MLMGSVWGPGGNFCFDEHLQRKTLALMHMLMRAASIDGLVWPLL